MVGRYSPSLARMLAVSAIRVIEITTTITVEAAAPFSPVFYVHNGIFGRGAVIDGKICHIRQFFP